MQKFIHSNPFRIPIAAYLAMLATTTANLYLSYQMLYGIPTKLAELFLWDVYSFANFINRLAETYVSLPYRVNAYLLGVVLGHILYVYEKGCIQRMPKILSRFGFYATVLAGTILYKGNRNLTWALRNKLIDPYAEDSQHFMALAANVSKAITELVMAIFLLVLTTNNAPRWISKILDNKLMQVLSCLTFGVFLNHLEIIEKVSLPEIPTDWDVLTIMNCGFLCLCFATSLFTHLLIELPVNNLTKKLFTRK